MIYLKGERKKVIGKILISFVGILALAIALFMLFAPFQFITAPESTWNESSGFWSFIVNALCWIGMVIAVALPLVYFFIAFCGCVTVGEFDYCENCKRGQGGIYKQTNKKCIDSQTDVSYKDYTYYDNHKTNIEMGRIGNDDYINKTVNYSVQKTGTKTTYTTEETFELTYTCNYCKKQKTKQVTKTTKNTYK